MDKIWEKIFGVMCFAFFTYTFLIQAVGSYNLNFFDGAIQQAAQNYIADGLIPFKDFSIIYSPGQYLLGGLLVPYKSLVISNIFYTLLFTGLLIWVKRLFRPNPLVWGVMLALSGIWLREYGGVGGLSYLLMALIFGLCLRKRTAGLFFFSALIVWWRWDWLLFFGVTYFGVTAVTRNKLRQPAAILAGYMAGVLTLLVYLGINRTLANAFQFMVYLPMVLTGTYRRLPLPGPTLPIHPNGLIYVAFLIALVILWMFFKYRKNENVKHILPAATAFIAAYLPYALGRSDWPHFVGLWSAVILVWSILISKIRVTWIFKLILPLCFLPLAGWYVKGIHSLEPKKNMAQLSLNSETAECKYLARDSKFSSVFVGRISYRRFLYNVASLYLLYPDARPATQYIMEEPGIQNSCKYGQLVATELADSEKPMLAILEKGDQPAEPNPTRTMTSCGKIENYLDNTPYRKIGECRAYGYTFEVRSYQ